MAVEEPTSCGEGILLFISTTGGTQGRDGLAINDKRDEAATHSGQDARVTRGRDARDTLGGSLKAAGFGDGRK
jgi:hypothetical protein